MKPPQKSPKKTLRKTAKATMATANSVQLDAPGVAAERGEDPAVDDSHGGEEGGGVKDNNDNKNEYHEGGRREKAGALLSRRCPLLLWCHRSRRQLPHCSSCSWE
jgi:hypothetical protein